MVSIIASVNPGQTSGVSSQFDVSTVLDEEDFLNNTTTANTEVTPSTDLSVTKTDSVDPAKTGGLLIYTLTATNNGPSNATGVVLEDALPEGVAFFSASPSICTANGALSCNFGNLSVDQSKQVAVTVTVEAPPETTLSNTATLSGEQTDPNGSNNSATELTEVELTADLEVKLEFSPEVPYFGLPTSFLGNFRNLGPDAANTGNVSVVFPGTFSIDSVSGSIPCNPIGSQVVCNFANLPSGQVESVSINATAPQGGDFPVDATVTSLSTDPVTENNTAQVMLSIPGDIDLKIVKEAVFDICGTGGPCWYEIEIENLGNGPLNGVLVTDELPAGLVINELTTEDPISCTEAETSFSCADVSINPGEVFHLLLEVQLAGSLIGPFANTVDAEAEGDQDPENNSSTAAVVGAAPGDANGDGLFNAADIVLLTLEKKRRGRRRRFRSCGRELPRQPRHGRQPGRRDQPGRH